jgi:hypothetical protein
VHVHESNAPPRPGRCWFLRIVDHNPNALRTRQLISYWGVMMGRLCSIIIALMVLTVMPTVVVAGPPTQLYGKSISYRWMDDVDFKTVDGHGRHVIVSHAVGMYISTRGRIFARNGRTVMGRRGGPGGRQGVGISRDPEGGVIESSNARITRAGIPELFKGHTLTGTAVFQSGAARVTVNFDERFRTCTLDVVIGKENGVPGIIAHAGGGRLVLSTHKVSGQNCTIADGNMFGDNSE